MTTTGPLVADAGTTAEMDVSVQLVTAAAAPLNVTPPDACVAPKCVPVMTTTCPAGPPSGAIAAITGGTTIVNGTLLLATPLTRTPTGPDGTAGGTTATIASSVQLSTTAA